MDQFKSDIEAFGEALRRAYEQGFQDGADSARQQVLAAISSTRPPEIINNTPDTQTVAPKDAEAGAGVEKRQRAPRGLPRALALRVMKANPNGVTPQQIAESAETDFEKMIAVSSIRSELRKGEADERYVEVDGVWHLADSDEAEGQDLDVQPSASSSNQERKHYAPSVADENLI